MMRQSASRTHRRSVALGTGTSVDVLSAITIRRTVDGDPEIEEESIQRGVLQLNIY